jgi:predicted PhzF superfamily epimerase YddE/YHI9
LRLPVFWADAFADRPFTGNPAAVCVVPDWPDPGLMQSIATEHNLSETAFIRPLEDGEWGIRWMTPVAEVDLCGHATLASAAVVRRYLDPGVSSIGFRSRREVMGVSFDGEDIEMDFPARAAIAQDTEGALAGALGTETVSEWRADYYLAELESESAVLAVDPDMARVAALGHTGVIVTAGGHEADFVCRFFAPAVGVPEDPVTGSAYCSLAPFWSGRLGKQDLRARQLSSRGGRVGCSVRGDRVFITGRVVHYMQGVIEVDLLRR